MPAARLVRPALLLAACLPVALAGCGPTSSEVSGVVTYNSVAPKLKGLQISFMSSDGRMASAPVAEDGSYKADAVPVGEVGVGFVYVSMEEIQRAKAGGKIPTPGGAPAIGPPPPPPPNPIPSQLREAGTSKVRFKVEAGKKNRFNYDIRP